MPGSLERFCLERRALSTRCFQSLHCRAGQLLMLITHKKSFLAVNPKRGAGLERYMQANRITDKDFKIAFTVIDEVAAGPATNTAISDPDVQNSYSFSLDRISHEPKL